MTLEERPRGKRKSPRDIVKSIMEALESEPKTIEAIAKEMGSSWYTAWSYLQLIEWIQQCPKVSQVKAGKRIVLYRREWGRLPT